MTDDFASKIARQITANAIKPRARWKFLAGNTAIKTLSLLSILPGAVSVTTLIHYFIDKSRTGGKGFDEIPLDDFFEIVPYFWFGFLLASTISATLAFRATPRGFLWRPTSIFALSIVTSTVCGVALHLTGVGPVLNREFADRIPSYARLIAVEDWRNTSPDRGRLVGESLGLNSDGKLALRDFTGRVWTVSVAAAILTLDTPLGANEDLDIRGTRSGPLEFTADAIFDWR